MTEFSFYLVRYLHRAIPFSRYLFALQQRHVVVTRCWLRGWRCRHGRTRTRGAKGGVGLAHKVPSSSHFVGFCSVCPLALPPSSVEQSDPPPPPHQPPPTASFVLIAPGEMTHTDTDAENADGRTHAHSAALPIPREAYTPN